MYESDSNNSLNGTGQICDDSDEKSSADDKEVLDNACGGIEEPSEVNYTVTSSTIDKNCSDTAEGDNTEGKINEGTDEDSNNKDSGEAENANCVINDNQIPTAIDTTNTGANISEVYYEEVDRIDNFSVADSTLLDKYGSCIPTNGTVPVCNTNPLYQPYHCPPSYPYQQDAQIYSHYEQFAQYNQQQNTAFNDQQTTQENENTFNANEQRSYTRLSTESQNDSRQSSVKTEPDNSSPAPPISTSNWSSYTIIPNMDMPEYNQYHQYGDYNKQDTRAYSEPVLNVPAKPMSDPMLAGQEMDDVATLESQAFNMTTSTASVYSSAVKIERDSVANQSPYAEQYQRGIINASEPDVKPKKSVRVPAGKLGEFSIFLSKAVLLISFRSFP